MTVYELIGHLAQLPPDAEVQVTPIEEAVAPVRGMATIVFDEEFDIVGVG
jgi:hypothetical protein